LKAAADAQWMWGVHTSFSRLFDDPHDPFHKTAWRRSVGALWDGASHGIALLYAALGPVVAVTSRSGNADFVSLTLEHRGGAIATVVSSGHAPTALPNETALFGTRGKFIVPSTGDWFDAAREGLGLALSIVAGHPSMLGYVLPDAAFGCDVSRILAAAVQSLCSGSRVVLK
jgi:predicted dehydrogenase